MDNPFGIKVTYDPGFTVGDPFEDETRRRLLLLERRVLELENKVRNTKETDDA